MFIVHVLFFFKPFFPDLNIKEKFMTISGKIQTFTSKWINLTFVQYFEVRKICQAFGFNSGTIIVRNSSKKVLISKSLPKLPVISIKCPENMTDFSNCKTIKR